MNIREFLKDNRLITDGAFGTYFEDRFNLMEAPENFNLSRPELVTEVHREYIEAGADFIRTNTFAANTFSLNCDTDELEKNICAAVENARKAEKLSGKKVFIAGDIGPLIDGEARDDNKESEYMFIADTFLKLGIDIIIFETLYNLDSILPVIREIKKKNKDAYVITSFCTNQFGYSNSGLRAEKLILDASSYSEIDCIGFNCGVGPSHLYNTISKIKITEKKDFIVMPNAGYPQRIRGSIKFGDDEEYFIDKMKLILEYNINILGGCCGTNPKYISGLRKLSDELKINQKNVGNTISNEDKSLKEIPVFKETKQVENGFKSGFLFDKDGKLKNKKFIAVELAPPVSSDDTNLLKSARLLKKYNIDVVTFPDSPSGRTRVDSVLMAEKVKKETGLNVMPHICCRDRNTIAMRSMFMGAHINDINDFLIITGDPIPSMDRISTKAVFNSDSVGLMKIMSDMNSEMFKDKNLNYGGAINQDRLKLDVEIKRVKQKIAAGANFFLTQPVFNCESAERLRHIKEETGALILCGIMPLISRKNALFMKNEIPGVSVTDEVVNMYIDGMSREEGEQAGISLARDIIDYTRDFVDGYYFSFPFNRVYMIDSLIDYATSK